MGEIMVIKKKGFELFKYNVSHYFKRLVQRFAIANYKNLHKTDYILRSDNELQTVRICRNLILNENSKLKMDPVTFEKYIDNMELNMYVFINQDSIDVIKNKYPQNIPVSPKSLKTILNIFDNHAHFDRVAYRTEIVSNLKLTLQSIESETKNHKKS